MFLNDGLITAPQKRLISFDWKDDDEDEKTPFFLYIQLLRDFWADQSVQGLP